MQIHAGDKRWDPKESEECSKLSAKAYLPNGYVWRRASISVGRLKNNSYVASIQLNPLALMTSYQDKSTISNNSIASHSAHFFTSYTLTMAASLTLMPKLNSIGANG